MLEQVRARCGRGGVQAAVALLLAVQAAPATASSMAADGLLPAEKSPPPSAATPARGEKPPPTQPAPPPTTPPATGKQPKPPAGEKRPRLRYQVWRVDGRVQAQYRLGGLVVTASALVRATVPDSPSMQPYPPSQAALSGRGNWQIRLGDVQQQHCTVAPRSQLSRPLFGLFSISDGGDPRYSFWLEAEAQATLTIRERCSTRPGSVHQIPLVLLPAPAHFSLPLPQTTAADGRILISGKDSWTSPEATGTSSWRLTIRRGHAATPWG